MNELQQEPTVQYETYGRVVVVVVAGRAILQELKIVGPQDRCLYLRRVSSGWQVQIPFPESSEKFGGAMRSSAFSLAHLLYCPSYCTEGVYRFSVSRRKLDQADTGPDNNLLLD